MRKRKIWRTDSRKTAEKVSKISGQPIKKDRTGAKYKVAFYEKDLGGKSLLEAIGRRCNRSDEFDFDTMEMI